MSRRCDITGKGAMYGNTVSHANNKRRRKFGVNLRTVRVTMPDGTRKKMRVAASTLRTLRKNAK